MAFDLDFAHVPSIPNMPATPSLTSGVSDKSKELMDRFTSNPGSLFQNPLTNAMNTLGGNVTNIETAFTSIASGQLISPSISASEAQTFLNQDGFEAVRTSMGNLMMHTDRLAGLTKSFGIEQPGLKDIMSIGMQMQSMMTMLNAGRGCLAVLGGATGLFSEDTLNGHANTLSSLLDRVTKGVATVAEVTDALLQIKNAIVGIMDKDSLFLQSCLNQLQTAATALALETINSHPCGHFVLEQITNRNPGGVMSILTRPTGI